MAYPVQHRCKLQTASVISQTLSLQPITMFLDTAPSVLWGWDGHLLLHVGNWILLSFKPKPLSFCWLVEFKTRFRDHQLLWVFASVFQYSQNQNISQAGGQNKDTVFFHLPQSPSLKRYVPYFCLIGGLTMETLYLNVSKGTMLAIYKTKFLLDDVLFRKNL